MNLAALKVSHYRFMCFFNIISSILVNEWCVAQIISIIRWEIEKHALLKALNILINHQTGVSNLLLLLFLWLFPIITPIKLKPKPFLLYVLQLKLADVHYSNFVHSK